VEASARKATFATPSLPCSLPYGTQVALLSPQPGSHTVNAASTPLILVASHDLPKTLAAVATDARGAVISSVALERTAKPASATSTAFPDPVYYRASGIGLRAHRHYTIALEDLAQNGCAPYAKISGEARFST
jgi:hypothetical protein